MSSPDDLVTATFLAGVLGLTTRRLRQLADDGVLPKARDGKMPLGSTVQTYIDWKVKAEIDRRVGNSVGEELKRERLERERARRLREARQLLPAPEVIGFADGLVGTVRTEMAGVAAQLTRDVPERRRIEHAINQALGRVADWLAAAGANLRAGGADDEADAEEAA